jgi:hypothetical protein
MYLARKADYRHIDASNVRCGYTIGNPSEMMAYEEFALKERRIGDSYCWVLDYDDQGNAPCDGDRLRISNLISGYQVVYVILVMIYHLLLDASGYMRIVHKTLLTSKSDWAGKKCILQVKSRQGHHVNLTLMHHNFICCSERHHCNGQNRLRMFKGILTD